MFSFVWVIYSLYSRASVLNSGTQVDTDFITGAIVMSMDSVITTKMPLQSDSPKDFEPGLS